MAKTDFEIFSSLIETSTLPDLGPGPREGVLGVVELEAKLKTFFDSTKLPESKRRFLRGAALLWHDHHEPAHEIAQEDQTAEGSFLHAILHRREPDYSNAKYWFRRVGQHKSFPTIGRKLQSELSREGLPQALISTRGHWDPMIFVDLCEQASGRPNDRNQIERLKQVQSVEFDELVRSVFD